MFDDLPPQDRVVCTVFDYIGLGFLLVVAEFLFARGELAKACIAFAIGIIFIALAHYWPKIKPRLFPALTSSIVSIANNFWSRRLALVIIVGSMVTMIFSFAISLRHDINAYVMPRAINDKQKGRLEDFLRQHRPFAITVQAAAHDEEAYSYANQIFNTFKEAGWDDTVLKGTETADSSQPSTVNFGLNLGTIGHPDIKQVQTLEQAFQSAHIEINGGSGVESGEAKIFILVGHRPLALHEPFRDSWRYKAIQWLERPRP